MKAGNIILVIVAVGCMMTSSAYANLLTELRLDGGGTAVAVTASNQVVNVQFWAKIEDATQSPTLTKIYTSFKSTGHTTILGDLTDAWPAGTTAGLGWRVPNATLGVSAADLDSDGDKDVGAKLQTSSTGWAMAYSGVASPQPGTDFYIMDVAFTATGWGTGHGVTVLEAVAHTKLGSDSWREHGRTYGGTVGDNAFQTQGQTITLYRPDDATFGAMDNGTLDIKLGGPGTLDAGTSVGSIDEWQWDVNGDGQYELKKAGATSMTFSVNLAGLVSWHDNLGDSGTWQATAAQQAGELVPIHLRTKYGNDASPLASDTTMAMLLLPEPATMALLGLGGLALAIRRRRAA